MFFSIFETLSYYKILCLLVKWRDNLQAYFYLVKKSYLYEQLATKLLNVVSLVQKTYHRKVDN